uniref:Vacuolar protein 8 n=1 Tax=Tetradesmus obliquus TaxID=3088 RepID=A0A383VXJ3_TETOB
MQLGFAGGHAAVCYLVVQLASSRGSSSSTVEAAAAALCTLAESAQDSQQLFAVMPAACIGLSQLLNSSCSNVQAAAALALADLAAGDDASRQQIAATTGTVQALVLLLNSSSDSVQAAAAAALCNLQQQVDLSNVDKPRLASLRACSFLTLEGFRKWLAARTSGIVLLSGEWLCTEVPKEQRQCYFDALAEQGYLQAAEGAEHLLLISQPVLQSLQQLLQQEELQAMQPSSVSGAGIEGRPVFESRDNQLPTDQGKQVAVLTALRNSIGALLPSASRAEQPGQDEGSMGQGAAGAGVSAADRSAPAPLPVDTCASLSLSASEWWDRGYDDSNISDSNVSLAVADNGARLTIDFKKQQQLKFELSVGVTMRACMQHKGNETLLGFKLQHIQGQVTARQLAADGASSSSGSGIFRKLKGVELRFMDRVCLSLQVQGQDDGVPLETVNINDPALYDVEKQNTKNRICYKYKDHVFKVSFEPGLVPKAMLALETSRKQLPSDVGKAVPLVTVQTQAQGEVPAIFGSGSSPCTVEAMRETLNTLLCARDRELGLIKSNPGTTRDHTVCYQVQVPREYLDGSGHLLADKLVVKVAICAVGGLLTTKAPCKGQHGAEEVEVLSMSATSMVDGRIIRLNPLLPLRETPSPGCKLHPRAPA